MSILPNNIKFLRNRLGITQEEFALKLGIKRGVAGSIETGRTEPSIELLKNLSKLFSVSISDLIENDLDAMSNNLTSEIDGEGQIANDKHPAVYKPIGKGSKYITDTSNTKETRTPFYGLQVTAGERGIIDWSHEKPSGFFVDIPVLNRAEAVFQVSGFSCDAYEIGEPKPGITPDNKHISNSI